MSDWKSDDIGELAKALAAAQGVIRDAAFDKVNPHFNSKFASLASILDAIRPVLSAHGLSFTQMITTAEGAVGIRTVLMHASGQWLSEDARWPTSTADPQKLTAAITYYRRSSLSALAGITGDEDDDGNAAAKPGPPPPSGPLGSQVDTILGLAGRLFPAVSMRQDLIAVCRRLGLPESSRDMSESQASALIRELERMTDAADGRAPDDALPEWAGGN